MAKPVFFGCFAPSQIDGNKTNPLSEANVSARQGEKKGLEITKDKLQKELSILRKNKVQRDERRKSEKKKHPYLILHIFSAGKISLWRMARSANMSGKEVAIYTRI